MNNQTILTYAASTPKLETSRLVLSRITLSDARDMYEYAKSEEVTRYLLWSPHPSLHHTKRYIKLLQTKYESAEFFDWGVHRKTDGKFIGTCGFAAIDPNELTGEIGYVFSPLVKGQGYATEAARAVLQFGFMILGLTRITARFMLGNDASEAVMRRLGMRATGFLPQEFYIKGEYRSILEYELTKDEFLAD